MQNRKRKLIFAQGASAENNRVYQWFLECFFILLSQFSLNVRLQSTAQIRLSWRLFKSTESLMGQLSPTMAYKAPTVWSLPNLCWALCGGNNEWLLNRKDTNPRKPVPKGYDMLVFRHVSKVLQHPTQSREDRADGQEWHQGLHRGEKSMAMTDCRFEKLAK